MSLLELRLLFEMLCEQMEEGGFFKEMHYESAYGIEMPQGVVMIFVFQEGMVVCRFSIRTAGEQFEMSGRLSADDCLAMTEEIWACKGGFRELFGEQEC